MWPHFTRGRYSNPRPFPLRYKEPTNITTCKPQKHVVYLKVSKCFSTTCYRIMKHAAFKYHLNILKPKATDHFYPVGPLRPRRITKGDALYEPGKTYDMIVDHMVFDYDVVSSMMPSDSFYVGVVREPYSQFKSAYNGFSLWNKFHVPIDEFLRAPQTHWDRHVRVKDQTAFGRNSMMFEFGFPEERDDLRDNETFIQHYVDYLDSKFDFVIITEYFDESLIYLRRLLCWKMEYVLYLPINVKPYMFDPNVVANSSFQLQHKKWSKADYYLYHHFLSKFKATLNQQGHDFFEELRVFRQALRMIGKCGNFRRVRIEGKGALGLLYTSETNIKCT
ncbi:galactosylceramide sulfotransferase-like [Lingula anatina]|uniref:Galactosylceramide sulfotransferase-like n=1 Tax=Lingula anatina TaxID=7574 RepID=A0A2R2MRD5_LINAN|nr:galactosylceramide sulfotransferase-like [Lingula anatina]|eukprot:XP_023932708.1 galactosylceramide sulfotransferase-like [Lingula anatina]